MDKKPTSDEVVNAVGAMAEMSWVFLFNSGRTGLYRRAGPSADADVSVEHDHEAASYAS